MILKRFRFRLAKTRFATKLLLNPVDLEIFKKKPSPRFIAGLFLIGFSYIIGWPLISVFGILAVYLKKPLLFAVGSPLVYGFSYLVFMLGAFVAGKDTIVYMNVFLQWSLCKGLKKILGEEAIASVVDFPKQ